MTTVMFLLGIPALLLTAFVLLAAQKNMLHWLPAYVAQRLRSHRPARPQHILFCFVDHYEPQWNNPDDLPRERERVDRWMRDYPAMASMFKDADGYHPKHSFFYPEEEYRKEHLDKLASLCQRGFGEIEIHLHHDNDTSGNLRQTLTGFAKTLHERHGALSTNPQTGQIQYGFIHGNWTLDNSDPKGEWCGVNDELLVLTETGCYADFTFPSAPHATQPSTINAIYYAKDDPQKPKSHNRGRHMRAGGKPWGDLLLINGPLMLNWKKRKFGIMPRIENADIRSNNPPTTDRVDLWVEAAVHVHGRPEWRFIKVHTHGAQDADMDTLLGDPVKDMHRYLNEQYNDGERYILHYVSARETYNIAKAAEAGKSGNPDIYRDYVLPRPSFQLGSSSDATE